MINQLQPAKYISFYDKLHDIYFTNYEKAEYSNLSRDWLFPIGLNNFDLETYFWWNGYLKWTGSINNISSDTYVWNTPIKWEFLSRFADWKIDFPIILQSTSANPTEVLISQNTYIKNDVNQSYTWLINAPIIISTWDIVWVSGVCSAISVWSYSWESMYFTDNNWNPKNVNITMPVDSCNNFPIDSNIWVYTRQWLWPWTHIGNSKITTINDTKYITFSTTHFTDFAVWWEWTWSFLINNWDTYTNSLDVVLNITMPTNISWMKFSNDWFNWSDWEIYTGEKQRTLSAWEWIKTVYAAFDIDWDNIADTNTSDNIIYNPLKEWQFQWNLTLIITWWMTQCVYGTSLDLWSQDGNLWTEWYNFSGDFSPANRYCADYKWLSGWVFTIQTTDLINENWGVISGSNVFISHDVPVVQGHDSCTGHNWDEIQFYGSPLSLIEKAEVANNDKICKVDISNVKLKVDVPAYQAPGNYIGTLTITLPNGFDW